MQGTQVWPLVGEPRFLSATTKTRYSQKWLNTNFKTLVSLWEEGHWEREATDGQRLPEGASEEVHGCQCPAFKLPASRTREQRVVFSHRGPLVTQRIRLPMQETQVQSLKISPEEETAALCSILDWEIPWTQESGGLQSMRSHRVGHGLATKAPHTTDAQLVGTGCSSPGKRTWHAGGSVPPASSDMHARSAPLAGSL